MTAFNIDISHGGDAITLTIIPKDDYFKIAYAEGILGAIKKEGADWILMEPDEIAPGELAPFENKLTPEGKRIVLGAAEVNQIAGEIENHLK
ncbi:hypothetical protein EZ456_13250 [Pedobacter psychrodurus]|uniref:Uncharacterized protein n=1 Tax=Pedobacter psychrodurus TaxID=2530456 RepID=A0A4R0PVG1_9SPHI|nr:hypothetical protein [Pedobacter psychrodurus]TCD26550.1 hypothetical protein EZ456_13250 [Pedobacter psychrodurus]